jgi:hypothetical protein
MTLEDAAIIIERHKVLGTELSLEDIQEAIDNARDADDAYPDDCEDCDISDMHIRQARAASYRLGTDKTYAALLAAMAGLFESLGSEKRDAEQEAVDTLQHMFDVMAKQDKANRGKP